MGTLWALCGGCSWYQAPELAVTAVERTEQTEEGLVLTFVLDARNENEVSLPLKTVRYSLDLDGERVFSGQRAAEATLRRTGTQRIFLPAAIALAPGKAPPTGDLQYTIRGELSYVTPGQLAELLFDAGVRRPTVGFREEGVVVLGDGDANRAN